MFAWLCQLRAAPYSYDWIDNRGRRSPQSLDPELQRLELGQRVMSIFELVDYAVDDHLTLLIHDTKAERMFGRLAATYRVTSQGPTTSRLVVRLLADRPRLVFHCLAPVLAIGDFVMMRKQLLNLKRLAEPSKERDC